jgi:hypothetical protein
MANSKQQNLIILLKSGAQSLPSLIAAGYTFADVQALFALHVNITTTTDASGDILYAVTA